MILYLEKGRTIEVGGAGFKDFPAGYYLYSGSALGSGGLKSRLGRHLSAPSRLHWHIDYLRKWTIPAAYGWIIHPQARECEWIAALAPLPEVDFPVRGFGAGDCRNACPAHLAHVPNWDSVRECLGRINEMENKRNIAFHSAVLDNSYTLC
jgi:Uri superfamily endonuclease